MNSSEVLIFQGCLSAVAFSGVLFISNVNHQANRFLAFLLLSLGLNLLLSWIIKEGLFNEYPILHFLPYGIGFGLAPLLYFYVWSLIKNKMPDFKPLLWIIADYPHSIYHLIYGREIHHEGFHEVLDKFGLLSLFVLAYYIWQSRKMIHHYQQSLRHKLSNTEQQTLSWLKQLITLFLISIPISAIFWILLITMGLDFDDRLMAYAFHVISIFWLGIGGVRQPEIILKELPTSSDLPSTTINKEHLTLLIQTMEKEKLFLLPDLNVRFLEDKLDITSKEISEALNQGLGKNFYSFINFYRVEEFKRKMKENRNLTLAGLALECGFNSKTTFQRVFKEITGMKPTDYLKGLN